MSNNQNMSSNQDMNSNQDMGNNQDMSNRQLSSEEVSCFVRGGPGETVQRETEGFECDQGWAREREIGLDSSSLLLSEPMSGSWVPVPGYGFVGAR